MSSAASGSIGDTSSEKNYAIASSRLSSKDAKDIKDARPADFSATSTVAAEAEQGDGPAAASASSSAVSRTIPSTSVVSVVVGKDYAAAACEVGVAVVGPTSASAASQIGVVAVGPNGAAATCNAANGSTVAVDKYHRTGGAELIPGADGAGGA